MWLANLQVMKEKASQAQHVGTEARGSSQAEPAFGAGVLAEARLPVAVGLPLADASQQVLQALPPTYDALAGPANSEEAKMLRKHRPLGLSRFWTRRTLSSGTVEDINNKAKLALTIPCGLRSYQSYELAQDRRVGNLAEQELAHR